MLLSTHTHTHTLSPWKTPPAVCVELWTQPSSHIWPSPLPPCQTRTVVRSKLLFGTDLGSIFGFKKLRASEQLYHQGHLSPLSPSGLHCLMRGHTDQSMSMSIRERRRAGYWGPAETEVTRWRIQTLLINLCVLRRWKLEEELCMWSNWLDSPWESVFSSQCAQRKRKQSCITLLCVWPGVFSWTSGFKGLDVKCRSLWWGCPLKWMIPKSMPCHGIKHDMHALLNPDVRANVQNSSFLHVAYTPADYLFGFLSLHSITVVKSKTDKLRDLLWKKSSKNKISLCEVQSFIFLLMVRWVNWLLSCIRWWIWRYSRQPAGMTRSKGNSSST